MNDIANYILMAVLGPSYYCKGIEYLRTVYDAPYLAQLVNTISYSNSYQVPVKMDADVIHKGMDELKRILDIMVDNYKNVTEEQKLACKCGNSWFVDTCYSYILSRCKTDSSTVL